MKHLMKHFLVLGSASLALAAAASAADAGGKHRKLDRMLNEMSNKKAAAAVRDTLGKLDRTRQAAADDLDPCPTAESGTGAPDTGWDIDDLPADCLMPDGTTATLTTTGPASSPNRTLWLRRGKSNTVTGTESGSGNQTVIIQD